MKTALCQLTMIVVTLLPASYVPAFAENISFIPQSGTKVLTNTDFESDTSGWSSVEIETANISTGLQSDKIKGVGFFKWYSYDLTPAIAGKYYSFSAQLSTQLSTENLASTPGLNLTSTTLQAHCSASQKILPTSKALPPTASFT
jgi:hypothetical protein